MNEFDHALIELFGINMTDAHITRYEALNSYAETGDAEKSALLLGQQRGLTPVAGVIAGSE